MKQNASQDNTKHRKLHNYLIDSKLTKISWSISHSTSESQKERISNKDLVSTVGIQVTPKMKLNMMMKGRAITTWTYQTSTDK